MELEARGYGISAYPSGRDGVDVRITSASSPDDRARLTPPRLEDAHLQLISENGEGRTP
jgi:hypothetical protein